jgi:uncharacterized SAM-binding protein YcdF (DUF218 family)
MLIDFLLAPGRYLCRLIKKPRHKVRFQARISDGGPVIPVSIICWAALFGLAVLLVRQFASPLLPTPAAAPAAGQAAPAAPAAQPAAPAPEPGQPRMAPSAEASGAGGSVQAAGAGLSRTLEPPEAAPPAAPANQVWLVIVESIPKSAREEAERSQARHRRRGVELELLDTDAYPLLRSGLWTLAMGPVDTKGEADAAAAEIRPKVRDLMVRRGL